MPRVAYTADNYPYKDEGCSLHPSCLTCPYPRCRYELHSGIRKMGAGILSGEISRLRAEGSSVAEIAQRFSVNKRTIYRHLRELLKVAVK